MPKCEKRPSPREKPDEYARFAAKNTITLTPKLCWFCGHTQREAWLDGCIVRGWSIETTIRFLAERGYPYKRREHIQLHLTRHRRTS